MRTLRAIDLGLGSRVVVLGSAGAAVSVTKIFFRIRCPRDNISCPKSLLIYLPGLQCVVWCDFGVWFGRGLRVSLCVFLFFCCF